MNTVMGEMDDDNSSGSDGKLDETIPQCISSLRKGSKKRPRLETISSAEDDAFILALDDKRQQIWRYSRQADNNDGGHRQPNINHS